MAKKTFNDIKRSVPIIQKEKIPMKVYTPIVEKKSYSSIFESKVSESVGEQKTSPSIPEMKINKIPDFTKKSIDNYSYENNSKKTRYTLWIVALVSVVFLFFALSFLFSSATVTVNPKINTISLNENLSATKDSSANGLTFDLMTLSDEESRTISSGEEKDLKESAQGKVVLYNNFSSVPQPLLIDTRLEGSNGKIYKTKIKSSIPGRGKDGTPGKVSVDIYALEPGPDYNSAPLDFKIFGFKSSPKYNKFYGRSVGDITGGFIGKSKQISDEEKTKNENELKATLQDKLYNKALSQIPQGFILYKDSTLLNIDDSNYSDPAPDGSVTLTMKGTLFGFVLDENKLTNQIVTFLLPDNKEDVYISNLKDLTFSLSNKEAIVFSNVTSINFNIYGVPKIVSKVDGTKLATDLSGKDKKDFNQILLQYTNIDSAEMAIRPIWKSSFPDKIEKIKVIINYTK